MPATAVSPTAAPIWGVALSFGSGIARDIKRAVQLLERACADEAKMACYRLGDMFQRGDGVRKNRRRAEALLAKACELGVPAACDR